MYLDPVNTIYQGDVISHFVYSVIDQPLAGELDPELAIPEDFNVKPRLGHSQALIVTQTCDAERRKVISIAPIFEIQTYIDQLKSSGKSEANIASELSQLKKQKILYYYYVPPDSSRGVKEGYADLTFINPVDATKKNLLNRIATISDYQRHVLAYKLGNLYLRPH